MTTQLCICNQCNTVLIDKNPTYQPEFDTNHYDVSDMTETFDKHGFWYGCPKCGVDDYLMDVETEEQINHAKVYPFTSSN